MSCMEAGWTIVTLVIWTIQTSFERVERYNIVPPTEIDVATRDESIFIDSFTVRRQTCTARDVVDWYCLSKSGWAYHSWWVLNVDVPKKSPIFYAGIREISTRQKSKLTVRRDLSNFHLPINAIQIMRSIQFVHLISKWTVLLLNNMY